MIFDDSAAKTQIMVNCGYNCAKANKNAVARMQARRRKHKTLDDFLAAEQAAPSTGTRLVREGDIVRQFYTPRAFTHPMRCYCSLLRGLPEGETVSPVYCLCSRGFVEKVWEAVLERPVTVDLVRSCVSGSDECEFVIHL